MDNSHSSSGDRRKVIIIGATSGIGEALAHLYAKSGYMVGVTGRRLDRLTAFQHLHLGRAFINQMDLTHPQQAMIQLEHLIGQMNGVDIIILNAGTGRINRKLDFAIEAQTIEVNVTGFTALADFAANYFLKQGHGHLVGISSINALRGSNVAPAYAASKAYISSYLQGLRKRFSRSSNNIYVTDIKPGFVETDMAQGNGLFWVAPVGKAAKQIKTAIDRKKSNCYVTRRWRLIAWLLKFLPESIYHRI